MPINIHIRRLLFFLAIIAFLIIAPLIVLYATGFRWDFEQKRITQVGMITVKCIPRAVNIFVNDKLKARRTYARIRDLMPRDYVVKLQKEGYSIWEKKLTVEPRVATPIKHARLFLSEPEVTQIINSGIDQYVLSPNNKKIAYTITSGEEAGIWLLDVASHNSSKLFPKSKEEFAKVLEGLVFSDIKWSPDSEKVLVQYKTKFLEEETEPQLTYHVIINTTRPQDIIFLEDLFKFEMEKVKWHPKDPNQIFWLNQGNFYSIKLDKKTLSPVLATQVLDFAVVNQDVYYVTETLKDTENTEDSKPTFQFIKKSLSTLEEELITDVSDLGAEEFCEILAGKKRVALMLGKDKSLYILDKDNELQKISDKTQKVIWDSLQYKLLYQNDYEIFVLRFVDEDFDIELEEPQQELITRYSEKIQDCLWYPDFQHIVFVVKNTIKIIELDGRDKRNVYELGKVNVDDPKVACKLKGKVVYFMDKKDKVKNIYQAKIY